jgi:hypothetical protein
MRIAPVIWCSWSYSLLKWLCVNSLATRDSEFLNRDTLHACCHVQQITPLPVSWSIIKTDLAPHCAETTQNCAQTTQIILANLASKKLILSVLAWPSRSSFDTCPREDWMTCCKDKPKPSCWSYLLSTVNLYQFEQNAHVNVHKFCSPPIDWVGWTFQQHDGQIKFHGIFTKKFKCPGRKIHSKSQSSNDIFLQNVIFPKKRQ